MTRSIEAIEADLVREVEAIGFCQEHALILKHETRADELRTELKLARAAARASVEPNKEAEAWDHGAMAALEMVGFESWFDKLRNAHKAASK